MERTKTYSPKAREVERKWWVVDAAASELTLGRMAAKISRVLQGKHKPTYAPHLDDGDFIVIVNAEQVKVTGKKAADKVYPYNTGWPSGLRHRKFADVREKKPGDIIKLAVKRMLPKNCLARDMLKKLKTYRGPEHPHAAQQPQPLDLTKI